MSDDDPKQHTSIVALVPLSAIMAASHPRKCLCQVDHPRKIGISGAMNQYVVGIVRNIRERSAQLHVPLFIENAATGINTRLADILSEVFAYRMPTPSGQSCC